MPNASLRYFSDALARLQEALTAEASHPLTIDGTVQRFEFTFELAWKSIKVTLLEVAGLEIVSPKQALQKAYALGWLEDEALWLNMLQDRNLTSHTYREALAREIYQRIFDYAPAFEKLHQRLKEQYST